MCRGGFQCAEEILDDVGNGEERFHWRTPSYCRLVLPVPLITTSSCPSRLDDKSSEELDSFEGPVIPRTKTRRKGNLVKRLSVAKNMKPGLLMKGETQRQREIGEGVKFLCVKELVVNNLERVQLVWKRPSTVIYMYRHLNDSSPPPHSPLLFGPLTWTLDRV